MQAYVQEELMLVDPEKVITDFIAGEEAKVAFE